MRYDLHRPTSGRPDGNLWLNRGAVAAAVLLASLTLFMPAASAATFTVTNTLDSGAGSLRQAIIDSNATAPGPNVVNFNLVGVPPFTIVPTSPLPAITLAVTINGYSQSGASANTNAFGAADNAVIAIALDGALAPAIANGLDIENHTGTVIRGLNIRNFAQNGVLLGGTGGGHTIAGCFIGTDNLGAAAAGNSADGVLVNNANNTIGGVAAADRNIISGNGQPNVFAGVEINGPSATGNTVLGNYVGTSASGTVAIGNSVTFGYGVIIVNGASNNTIGSSTNAGNVISGNGGALTIQGGVNICNGNSVVGNLIGTNTAGTAALGNKYGLGDVAYTSNTVIGGTTAGARNVISGNGSYGILIGGSSSGYVVVEGNFIGTDVSGTAPIPNTGDGILYEDSGAGNTGMIGGTAAGSANVIAFNTGNGVNLKMGSGTPLGDAILGNSIHDNGKLGIDLNNDGVTPNNSGPTGPNHLQNYPVLSSVATGAGFTHVIGTLNSAPSTAYRVEFFSNTACDASGFGEGQTLLGVTNVTTDASGAATIDTMLPVAVTPGQSITSTATDPTNDTSEFSACAAAIVAPATVAKSFSPASIAANGTSLMTITLTNPSASPSTSVAISDTYPAGLVNANPTNATTTCGGTLTSAAGGNSMSLTGGTIPAGGSCTLTVNVTSASAGSYVNTTGIVSGSQGSSASGGTATLTVASMTAPTVTKTFAPTIVGVSSPSLLRVTLTNPNGTAVTGVAFADAYPAGLVNAATPNASSTCGGSATATAGGGSLALSGGTIPANGNCTVTVSVLAAAAGTYVNTLGAGTVTSLNAAPQAAPAAATLQVSNSIPALSEAVLALLMLALAGVGVMMLRKIV